MKKTNSTHFARYSAIALGLIALSSHSAYAANNVWDGSANDRWNVNANWTLGTKPVAGDTVIFFGNQSNPNTTLEENFTVNSIRFLDLPSFPNPIPVGDYSIGEGVSGAELTLGSGNITADGGSQSIHNLNLASSGIWQLESNAQVEIFGRLTGHNLTKTGTGTMLLTGGLAENRSILTSLQGEGGAAIIDGGHIRLISDATSTSDSAINVSNSDFIFRNGSVVQMTSSTGAGFIRNGTLLVTDSGTSFTGDRCYVGIQTSDVGNIVIENGASINMDTFAFIGFEGVGDLILRSGGQISTDRFAVGVINTTPSTVLITGSGTQALCDQFRLGGQSTTSFGGVGEVTLSADALVQVNGDTSFYTSSSDLIINGGRLETQTIEEPISGVVGSISISDPSGASALTVGAGNDNSTFNGVIQNASGGAGSITKAGSGTLTLLGNNTYSGGTFIDGGTVEIDTSSNLGIASAPVTIDGAVLQINETTTFTHAIELKSGGGTIATPSDGFNFTTTITKGISGTGVLTKTGPRSLALLGASTYTGLTTISGGKLTIGNGGTTGSVVSDINNNALLEFNNPTDSIYTGIISGSGSLRQSGAGIQTLKENQTYTGGTWIQAGAGALRLGDGGFSGSITGDIINDASLIFSSINSVVFSDVISGVGSVTKEQTFGSLTFTGNNTYTGGTTIEEGILRIGNGGSTGSIAGDVFIASGAVLAINRSGSIALNGVISGAGAVTKTGSGTLTLTGANTYSGATTVEQGILLLDAATGSQTGSSNVEVKSGATFGGNGLVVGAVSVNSGATVAPGTSAGTLTVNSFFTLSAGGVYRCELDGANADRLVVGDGLFLSGTLDIDVLGGGATEDVYIIATYGTLFSPSFAEVLDLPAGYEIDYAYNGNQIALVLSPYKSWAVANGLTEGVNDGLNDNPDGDAWNNRAEYALDGDPLNATNDGKVSSMLSDLGGLTNVFLYTFPTLESTSFSGTTALSGTNGAIVYAVSGTTNLTTSFDLEILNLGFSVTNGMPALNSGWIYKTFTFDFYTSTNPFPPAAFIKLEIESAAP